MPADGTCTILVVEEQATLVASLVDLGENYRILNAKSVIEARTVLVDEEIDMVMCHLHSPT